MKRSAASIVREYGPFPNVSAVHGVSYDGTNIWIATGDTLNAVDPDSGKTVRALNVPAHAGTAFDGRHLFQISDNRIQKVDPVSGRVLATIPTPEGGASGTVSARSRRPSSGSRPSRSRGASRRGCSGRGVRAAVSVAEPPTTQGYRLALDRPASPTPAARVRSDD